MQVRQYQQGWRDIQLELERKVEDQLTEKAFNHCPDCSNQLYFTEGGFLCPVCGYSSETIYMS